jgi:uncharacterized protein YcaQ
MIPQPTLSKLKRATLQAQGLNNFNAFGKGQEATRKTIEHLRYVQIDSLSVIARAHHHVLWTRVPTYEPRHLETLMKDRVIFEYWFHAAAFLPMSDYRFALVNMKRMGRDSSQWFGSVTGKDEQRVLDRIRAEGPLRSRDFQSAKTKQGSWWNWKPAKKTLEKLFFDGTLMVSGRDGIQKLYDLRERALPQGVNTQEPSMEEFARYLIDAAMGAHGFTTEKQIVHLRKGSGLREAMRAVIKHMVNEGQIAQYLVQGCPTIYAASDFFEKRSAPVSAKVRFLSPFDNAIIHRDRAQWLFEYDYRIECYTPAAKRKFGYFCLPILYRGDLVGRIDCKAVAEEARLDVLSLHIEKDVQNLEVFIQAFHSAISDFAKFNACDNVRIHKVLPKAYDKLLKNIP